MIFSSAPRERGVEASGMCVDRGQEVQESPPSSNSGSADAGPRTHRWQVTHLILPCEKRIIE